MAFTNDSRPVGRAGQVSGGRDRAASTRPLPFAMMTPLPLTTDLFQYARALSAIAARAYASALRTR